MKKKKHFRLYANCIPVKGAKRAVICDIQKGELFFIPEAFYRFILELLERDYDSVCLECSEGQKKSFNNNLDYLIKNEIGFFTCDPELFPPLEMIWDYPGKLSNAIVEIEAHSDFQFEDIFSQLEKLGCKHLELRFYSEINLNIVLDVLSIRQLSDFSNVDLLLKFQSDLEPDLVETIVRNNPILGSIICHSAPRKHEIQIGLCNVSYTTENLTSNKCCGNVHSNYFSLNIEHFSEATLFNTCLNRKVAIDSSGNIKNCPSLNKSYGNIRTAPLGEAIEGSEFQSLWRISKDQIEVCKDCEFRYICTDCRAYLEQPNNIYSKPLKCGYDPYLGVWSEWSKNPLKEAAITHYEMGVNF